MIKEPELWDICARRHGGNARSTEANRATNKLRDALRILDYLKTVTDATCDEAEQVLTMTHQPCSARFAELKRAGRIEPTVTRTTRTGCRAQAWRRATP